ncbi:MAG: extracellular solute-binding protein [Cellulosilyticum sp.]|nr:extracellular solute-binding protein [Cellulosilyticum sp.]
MLSGCQSNKEEAYTLDSKQEQYEIEQEHHDGVVELTLWGAQEDAELLEHLIDDFKEEYSSQAQFEITVDYHSESKCKEDLFKDTENQVDVFTFADDQLRPIVAAGLLAPVSNPEEVRKSNIEAACEAASINETLYAYPMTADNGYFLYYNKNYFTDQDVESLDTILQIASQNNKKVSMDWTSGWYLYAFFGQTGLELGLNKDGISNYCNWNATDTAIKGIDVANSMLAIAKDNSFLNCTEGDFIKGIQEGSIIAGVSGIWNTTVVEEAWGSNYGATKLPTYSCANKQMQMASFAGYKMVGVSDYSSQKEWAQKLAQWITNEANQIQRFKMRGQGPSNINAAATPEIAKSPAIDALLEQSGFASLQQVGGAFWEPTQIFGEAMAAGNPEGKDLQVLLDVMTEGITESYSNGGVGNA